MLLGPAIRRDFTVDQTRFDYVFFAPQGTNADLDLLVSDARQVVESFRDLMGGLPFDHVPFHHMSSQASPDECHSP